MQARMGSTRLPGKVLRPFGESTLLGHILERLDRTGLDAVVATTDALDDDAVAAKASRAGAAVFRGSESDVLRRFADCVRALDRLPDRVLRICADRPFVCPQLILELLDVADRAGRPDYVANTIPKSFPDGLDLELISTAALLEADATASDAYDREHVTPFIYRNPERFGLLNVFCPFGDYSGARATIDTEQDHDALSAVHERLVAMSLQYTYRHVVNLATVAPELFP